MNMKKWCKDLLNAKVKPAMPILSFPAISLLNIGVKELISNPELQAKGMKTVADHNKSAASVSMMDLSVEAEAFGSTIRVSDDEVPTVIGSIAGDMQSAKKLTVPEIGTARTGIYIEAIKNAVKLITDRPVFAGIIGPFSLAGRLIDVNEAFIKCYEEPELVHTVMEKATEFLIKYALAYKDAGANGIVMAEPLTGLLSPDLAEEFSEPYVKQIIDAVQDENFIVIYHNCGDGTIRQIESILRVGASAYHFGNSISMKEMLSHIPDNILTMGNVDPAAQFRNGTVESVKAETKRIMSECCTHKNFVISSGCDIPPLTPWDNIDAFFEAVNEYYAEADKISEFIEKCRKTYGVNMGLCDNIKEMYHPELREACAANTCGNYGKCHTCPPHIGSAEECIKKASVYKKVIVFQKVYNLDDSYDFYGMIEGQKQFKTVQNGIAKLANDAFDRPMILGAGGCTVCERCAAKDNLPCRNPEKAFASLESYCIQVSELAKEAKLNYTNGQNTVTYFGGIFLK